MWIPLRSRVIHVEPFNQNGNTIGTTVSPSLGRCKKNARMRALGNKRFEKHSNMDNIHHV